MNEKSILKEKEFERRFNKLKDLQKIRLQNFILQKKVFTNLTLQGISTFLIIGMLLISPIVILFIYYSFGLVACLRILGFTGIIILSFCYLLMYNYHKENKKCELKIEEFLENNK